MKKIAIIGLLNIGLMSPTLAQCDDAKWFLGFGTLLTGALSYTFFKESREQRQLLETHAAVAQKFKDIKENIDSLSKRLTESKSNGADIKMKAESDAIKSSINKLHATHPNYLDESSTINRVFSSLERAVNKNDRLLNDACESQKEANEKPAEHHRQLGRFEHARSLFKGWLACVCNEARLCDNAFQVKAETLQSRQAFASRLGNVCAGFGIACAAALVKIYYWPTARA